MIKFNQIYDINIKEKYWKIIIDKPDKFKFIKYTFMKITLMNPYFDDFPCYLGLKYFIISASKEE
mgnify:CR=1 FL=1